MSGVIKINKAKQFYDILKRDILNNKYHLGEKLPSIRDFAKMYGISRNTVNTVIAILANEGFVTVKDGLGTFVTENVPKAYQIGVMIFDFATSMRVDTDILNAIQKNLKPGYYLTLIDTAENFDVFLIGLKRLVSMGASGIIAVPPKNVVYTEEQKMQINSIIDNNIPLAFIIRNIEGVHSDYFSMDLSKGIIKALEYFAMSGKKKIGIVLHDTEKFKQEELYAFRKMAKPLELDVNEKYMIDYSEDLSVMEAGIKEILPEVDGFIAPDHIIYKLRNIFFESGKKIPNELSLVGINDTLYSKLLSPPLTSIAFPVDKIGKYAVDSIIRQIEGGISSKKVRRNFAPYFIIRGT